jgi:hypothetical protein
MTKPREAASLQEIARRLAEVFVAASSLIGRSEEQTRLREEETARVAEVLGRADPAARRRVMSARRAATAAELRAAHALADEMRYQAGSRALASVHRYAGTLALEAEEENARRRSEIAELGATLGRLESGSARALLEAVEQAEGQRVASARRQADDLTAQIQAALGVLPRPVAEVEEERPRSRKARRRARRARVPDAAGDGIVQLDPNRNRTAN